MGKAVDRFIAKMEAKGYPKGTAIAIGKSQRIIKQKGKHLVSAKGKK